MSDWIEIGDGLIVGTGEPDPLELEQLRRRDVATVIDLRRPSEATEALTPAQEEAEARRLGLTYLNLPVDPASFGADELDAFRAELMRMPRRTFVHCSAGKRSGSFALADKAIREGWSGEKMLAEAESRGLAPSGAKARETYRDYVDSAADRPLTRF